MAMRCAALRAARLAAPDDKKRLGAADGFCHLQMVGSASAECRLPASAALARPASRPQKNMRADRLQN
jgi:hypothetical protein